MILQFRTERNRNGNCHYLAIDTGAEVFSTVCRGWIAREFYKLSVADYRALIKQLEGSGYRKADSYIC